MAVFTVINVVETRGKGNTEMSVFDGFYTTNPKLSFLLTLALFSLAGIPPFAGMFCKFFVFMAAAEQGSNIAYAVVFLALVRHRTVTLLLSEDRKVHVHQQDRHSASYIPERLRHTHSPHSLHSRRTPLRCMQLRLRMACSRLHLRCRMLPTAMLNFEF